MQFIEDTLLQELACQRPSFQLGCLRNGETLQLSLTGGSFSPNMRKETKTWALRMDSDKQPPAPSGSASLIDRQDCARYKWKVCSTWGLGKAACHNLCWAKATFGVVVYSTAISHLNSKKAMSNRKVWVLQHFATETFEGFRSHPVALLYHHTLFSNCLCYVFAIDSSCSAGQEPDRISRTERFTYPELDHFPLINFRIYFCRSLFPLLSGFKWIQ